MQELLYEAAKLLPTSTERQEVAAELLKTGMMTAILFVASAEDLERRNRLFRNFKPMILEGIEQAEQFVHELILDGVISSANGRGAALYLQQGRMALSKEDFDGMQEAFESLFGLFHATYGQLIGDIAQLQELARQLRAAFTTGMNDKTNQMTAISRLM